MQDPALKVSNLTIHYNKTVALWDVNLEVPKGLLVGILGPNGAGKSTFMKAILGLSKKQSGSVFFLGKRLNQMRGSIAYVPQKESIDWDFPITVKELVLLGRYPKKRFFSRISKEDREVAERALKQVGMHPFSDRQISELSGGQQQRVFLARAIAQDADLYFLDEPLRGVDHTSEEIIMTILQKMKEEGKTVFVVHHDLNTVEAYFDWLILLNGRLIASGDKKSVLSKEILQETYGRGMVLFNKENRVVSSGDLA